jgi:hypothetical protein
MSSRLYSARLTIVVGLAALLACSPAGAQQPVKAGTTMES